MEVQDEISLGTGQARRDYDLRISPLTDGRRQLTGRLIFLHDITERKQAERTIADERSPSANPHQVRAVMAGLNWHGSYDPGRRRFRLQMPHLPGQPEDWIGRTLADVAKACAILRAT